MELTTMCRICLVEDVRMRVVVNSNLLEMYESLTSVPLEVKDNRPTKLCYICYARLRNCCQLKQDSLQSEELLTRMLNSNLVTPGKLESTRKNRLTTTAVTLWTAGQDEMEHTECGVHREQPVMCEIKIEPPEYEVEVNPPAGGVNKEYNTIEIKIEPPDVYEDVPVKMEDVEGGFALKTYRPKTYRPAMQRPAVQRIAMQRLPVQILDVQRLAMQGPAVQRLPMQILPIQGPVMRKPTVQRLAMQRPAVPRPAIQIKPEASTSTKLEENPRAEDILKEISRMRTDTDSKIYECDICHKWFSEKVYLKYHLRTHTGERPYQCHICQKRFYTNSDLHSHMRTHSNVRPHECDKCKKTFRHKGNLKRHYLTHTGEKPFPCSVCNKGFSQKGALNDHMRTHTGEKPFQCHVCKKSFNVRSSVKHHMRAIHRVTGTSAQSSDLMNLFQCDMCKKYFKTRNAVSKHMAIHTVEKPYKCAVCQRNFSNTSHLKKHARVHVCKELNADKKEDIE